MNALQRAADICLPMAVKKGFAVSWLDAMWKGRPVIGGRSGSIPLQIIDGVSGYTVQNPRECAARIEHILTDPAAGRILGEAGHAIARERHTITRYLRDYLSLFRDLSSA